MLTDLTLLLLLILVNGTLALSEIAIVSSRRSRLARMADAGSAGARRALALAAEPTRFLSTVQVGITSIGILSGAIGEATLAGEVRLALGRIPAVAAYAEPLSRVVVVVGITYLSLILGELVPKRLALMNPEKIAGIIARPMQLLARAGRPIVYVLTVSTDAVVRLLGARPVDQAAVTMEDIKVLIRQGTEQGVLEPGEHEMMANVLNLDERYVGAVLTPRSEIAFLDLREPVERHREKLRHEPHDAFPLCDGGLEHVVGFVRVTRVLDQVLDGRPLDLRALAEPAPFVPETMTLLRLLERFKRTNFAAALVVDEFGDVAGIVSLADVISSIVGELPAERPEEAAIVKRDDNSWLLDGRVDLGAVAQALGDRTLLRGEDRHRYHTLGGLAMASLGRVPRTGDVFERGRFRFEVMDMDGNRVDRVLATRVGA